jgi:hypothetical protein
MDWRNGVDTTKVSEAYVSGAENHAEKAVGYSNAWRLYAGLIAVASQASIVLILLILLGEVAGANSLHTRVTHEMLLIKWLTASVSFLNLLL